MLDNIILLMYLFPIWAIPTATLIWFIVSLVRYFKYPKAGMKQRHSRKVALITSGVISAFVWGALIFLVIMFSISLQHM